MALLVIALGIATARVGAERRAGTPMSFYNRVLLNRLAVLGYQTVEVMLLVTEGEVAHVKARLKDVRGRVVRAEPSIGYLRADLPINRLVGFVTDASVEAYQISSLALGSLSHDAQPQSSADLRRGYETGSAVRLPPKESRDDLPPLLPAASTLSGYTADEDVGVGAWLAQHPTFDGRGVTIALLESAEADFSHPTLRSARALDGTVIPKLAGVVNAIDPRDADRTRVELDTDIRATHSWHAVGRRTYILPQPGRYRFGVFTLAAGGNLVQQFGVIRNEVTREIRVDANGDADFRDEMPVADVNTRMDVRVLRVSHPRQADLPFVVAEGRQPDRLHIYTARDGHQAMTISVAAGSRTHDGLAYGVAPGARVLLVRYVPSLPSDSRSRLRTVLEGYLDTIKRRDVDVLCDSTGISDIIPNTAGDFVGLFFRKLIATYRKPIFHSAGNTPRLPTSVSAAGDVFSVGGAIGPATFAALYGGATLGAMAVHPVSAAGPALDGALKPDFLVPANRISAGVRTRDIYVGVPKNAPTASIPPGYEISCCTSASSPYAAGVAALLLSAAKQQEVPYSVESLGRALRVGAQFLQDWPAHQQGNGVLDVNAAWRQLQRSDEVLRIRVSASNVHPLTPYAASGADGVGLFEQEGWRVGSKGRRILKLRRESGTSAPVTYRLSWTGNDGTFTTTPTITLPFNEVATLPLFISIRASGAHSAILNLHDAVTNAVVFRTQATVIASKPFDTSTKTVRFAGSVPLLQSREHFMSIPDGVSAISIQLEVIRGSLSAAILPNHGVSRPYYDHVEPGPSRTFPRGRYSVLLPHPDSGAWSINLSNVSAWQEADRTLVSGDDAVYTISVKLLDVSLEPRHSPDGSLSIDLTNRAAELIEPVIETSTGTLKSYEAQLSTTGWPNQFEIDVPAGTPTLLVQLRATGPDSGPLELHLYDCTSGECFSWDFTLPAATQQTMVVRHPKPGRWVAAVNAAPVPTQRGRFILEQVITTNVRRHHTANVVSRATGATWRETLDVGPAPSAEGTGTRVIMCELVDLAAERDAAANPWETRKELHSLADRTIAAGTAILRVN